MRLVLGSFFVFFVRSLAGKTVLQPMLGLAGACFMTILILQPVRNKSASAYMLADLVRSTQQEIEYTIHAAQSSGQGALYESIAAELVVRLEAEGILCNILLEHEANGSIIGAELWCEKAQAEKTASILSGLTGVETKAIRYMGETCDGVR